MPQIDITLGPAEVAGIAKKAKPLTAKTEVAALETPHSPGPWREAYIGTGVHIVDADGSPVAVFFYRSENPHSDADVALTLAAGDLLAALKAHAAFVRGDQNPFGHDCDWCGECCQRVVAMQIRAVKKAETL